MLFPLIPLIAAFVFDKLFFIGETPYYFLNTASFVNYEHKEELIFEMKEYLSKKDRKKVLAIFGNSRTTSFSNSYIEKNYPDWILYNFSVPGGTSDYFYYLMGKFQKHNVRPDFILFTVTPQGFNNASRIQMDEVMVYALPPAFIIQNLQHLRLDDITNYIAKKLFLSYKNKPLLTTIADRLKNHSEKKEILKFFISRSREALKESRGSVNLSPHEPVKDEVRMKKNAEDIINNFLRPFQYSKSQHYFTEKFLFIARELNIPSALLWARVSPDLRQMKNKLKIANLSKDKKITVREAWEKHMIHLADKYKVKFLDMNYETDFQCDLFQDASHMAGHCFPEFTDYLFNEINDIKSGRTSANTD